MDKNIYLRKIVLFFLKLFNPGLIKIRHPITDKEFFLDAYLHKGYWYRGKNYDVKSIKMFKKLIDKNEIIIEVGAHIGFMTHLFAYLVGKNGEVYAFEPGINNLPYLKKNIDNNEYQNIVLIEEAVTDKCSTATFYMEKYTGQNNSLIPDHIGAYSYNKIKNGKRKFTLEVKTTSLDLFYIQHGLANVHFIKVDIEAGEFEALIGMRDLIQKFKPCIMFEVSRNHQQIFKELSMNGYVFYNDNNEILNEKTFKRNIYAIHTSNTEKLNRFLNIPG